MNKKEFERMVAPYLTPEGWVHPEALRKNFTEVQGVGVQGPGGGGPISIIHENSLLYIPSGRGISTGVFLYSDNSDMYCYTNWHHPSSMKEGWIDVPTCSAWSSHYRWIRRRCPISNMNHGEGWRCATSHYFILANTSHFINWTENPFEEVKE